MKMHFLSGGRVRMRKATFIPDAFCTTVFAAILDTRSETLTYSSAEMFAAGFQDHGIGLVLGTSQRTGGGGASPWHQSIIHQLSKKEVFKPLPNASTLRVAVRRCQRVHARSGQAIEGVGVTPDVLHLPTHNDLLNCDDDLLEKVGALLAQKNFPS